MTIVAWPVVDRNHVVHAYKPGEPSGMEGPFRTLRAHAWASPGVRVTRRAGSRLAGQLTLFSSLNVESARLARHGNATAAPRLARAAGQVEAGPEFVRLQQILSDLPGHDAERVVEGVLPEDSPASLMEALKAVARRTEQLRASELIVATLAEVITGRVAEVHEGYVVLIVPDGGPTAMVPRWMAVAAQRDTVGALLALVMDKLYGASAVVEAVPAIDIGDACTDMFSPFGRGDARVHTLTPTDELLLTGEPQPLRILVPVLIGA